MTLFHGGDTLWHGCFWKIARLHGPVDIAFLPINGAVIEVSGLKPSGIEAVMTPEQAAAAAAILGARLACPIHYGMFHRPPTYVETRDAVARFRAAAGARGIAVLVAAPGELVPLPNDDPER
jgi:L-ascorbate metabolism protein UlaG (beta-lactamase superfamily)